MTDGRDGGDTSRIGAEDEAPSDHTVVFYERDEELVATLVADLAPGLAGGDVVLVIATLAHRRALEAALAGLGLDVEAHRRRGTYVASDAASVLDELLVRGRIDRARFEEVVGRVVGEAVARAGEHRVRAFGEMVGLLWDRGEVGSAIELEDRWNDLARTHPFSLVCAYPMPSVQRVGHLADAHQLCRQHAAIVPPASYEAGSAPGGAPDDAERERLFVPVPLAARAVRSFVRRALEDWGCADVCGDDAELIASELAGNALVHARSPFRVVIVRHDGGIRLSVRDAEPATRPHVVEAREDATSGRGVAIVAAVAARWGVVDGDEGKTVWAELLPAGA